MKGWMRTTRFALLLVVLMCQGLELLAQRLNDSIAIRLNEQLQTFPQEKVALHVDRSVLLPGDTVRVKAYVVDAATLQPLLDDQFVYVELLDAQNRSLQRKRLIASNNLYTGYLYLPPNQKAGVYHLWAYTLYSSQVKGFDCLVPIQVGSDEPAKSETKRQAEPVVRFFPEGGSLVEGTTCMVAFEATTANGDSLEIEGDVTDSKGNVVSRFKTFYHGQGFFPLAVQAGERYTAVCRDRRGRKYSFRLPAARADVACLHCRVKSDEVQVTINCGTAVAASALQLLVHCRGRQVSLQPVQPGTAYHLPQSKLPAGVNSLMLLDGEGRVMSERLVFSNNSVQRLSLSLTSDKAAYGLRDSIPLTLSLPDMLNEEVAFLSLSATDDGVTLGRRSASLWCQLLLASDLQGLTGQTDDYFTPTYRADRVDLLMMVNGWRRYDVASVLQGRYAEPTVQKEHEQRVGGRVRSVFSSKPVGEAQVVLAITKQNYIDTAVSDSAGRFEFHGLNYPDDVDVFVYALRQKNRRCIIETDKDYAPFAPDAALARHSAKLLPWMDIDNDLLERYARDSHLLQEVVVKGHSPNGGLASLDNTTLSLDRKQIAEGEYPDLGFLLLCTNLLQIDRGNGTIHADDMSRSGIDRLLTPRQGQGATAAQIDSAHDVKLYVNGMFIPDLTFDDLDLEDIDRVDLYLGTKAWVFGTDVGAGVVNVTMRNGLSRSTSSYFNNKVLHLAGYQKPVEYYFPRYEQGARPSTLEPDLRRTLYWNPYLRMVKDTPLQLSFYSADLPTHYSLRIEGITSTGRIVEGDLKLEVYL